MDEVKTKEFWSDKAKEIWADMTRNEQFGVRFGMFPLKRMEEAEKEGYRGKELAVALMQVAKENGGMIA